MRKFKSLFLLVLLALTPAAKAQKVTCDNYNRLQVEFVTGDLKSGEVNLGGQVFSTLSIEGYTVSSEVGAPCLPTYTTLIEVPMCEDFEVVVSEAVFDTLESATLGIRHSLVPLQPSRSKSDTSAHPLIIGDAYNRDAYCGAPLALVEAIGTARDRRFARLQFSPVLYNPVNGILIVCRQATVTVRYIGADREATLAHFERYHSPAFGGTPTLNDLYPKAVRTTAPVRYLIVANSMFRGQLDSFVQWKRRKGFLTDIVYTDSSAVGTTTTSIQNYIRSQYTNATTEKPAPTYLLLVGDHEQLPAFTGTTDNDHITDLYYTTWTSGDNLPDCYCGRFSAQNISQLTPQMQKTLMYEQYTFADPSFLDRAVMVAGVDGGSSGDYGYTHADPAMDYAIINYINGEHGFSQVMYFKNDVSRVPAGSNITVNSSASSNSALVRSYYNQGAGLINYSAHGSATSWGTPNFTTSHVSSMTNSQKFGLMIGNCCLTNKFETTTCFGESLLRKGNYCGAVGYIGGSNSTYWYEDFYWAVGLRTSSSIGPSMSMAYSAFNLGIYDRVMHTHGEAYSQWAITQGAIMFQGNMAVESSSSSRKLYYWEIYHLMGDPSVMPYLTQAAEMNVNVVPIIVSGTPSLTVSAAPHAYIALTDSATHNLVSAAYADASGSAILTLPSTLSIGTYELAASAQQYRTAFHFVRIIAPTETFAYANALEADAPLEAGSAVPLAITVANLGINDAHDVVLQLSSDNAALTFSVANIHFDTLPVGVTLLADSIVYALVADNAADESTVTISINSTWDNCTQPIITTFMLTLTAPVPAITTSGDGFYLMPGDNGNIVVNVVNNGHAPLAAARITLDSPTLLLNVDAADTAAFNLAAGSTVTRTFNLTANPTLPQGALVPLRLRLGSNMATFDSTVNIFIGAPAVETFENGIYHTTLWTQGTYPWGFDATTAHNGSYSMRSSNTLDHSQTAELTVNHTFANPDSISFYYKVSSESNYDKFHFYIDGTDMLTESGEVDWTRAVFAVSAGSHSFRFTYAKDYSVNQGSDCAWIDDIAFPIEAQNIVFHGDTLCTGELYIVCGDTIDTQEPTRGVRLCTSDGVTTVVDYLLLPATESTDSVVTCDSYLWEGTEFFADTTLTRLLTNRFGCDSTVTLALIIHQSVYDTVVENVEGSYYRWNGTIYNDSGEYEQIFTAANGCDSTVLLILTLSGEVGIPEWNAENGMWKVWPNPTTGIVRFDRQIDEVLLYDASGRLLDLRRDVQELDFSTLPAGQYLLKANFPEGSSTMRIIRK